MRASVLLLGTWITLAGSPAASAQDLFGSTILEGPAAYAMRAGDVNGDGRADLVESVLEAPWLQVHFGLEGPGLAPPFGVDGADDADRELALGDVDEDGALDLLTMDHSEADHVRLRLGLGDGTFGPAEELPVQDGASHMLLVDLDDDGHLDVYVATSNWRDSVLWGRGQRGFLPAQDVFAGFAALNGAAGDVDADGFCDVVLDRFNLPYLHTLLHDGPRSFADPVQSDDFVYNATGMVLVDLGVDGRADLIGGGQSMFEGAQVRTSLGDGSFGPPTELPLDTGLLRGLRLADMDEDGVEDVVFQTGYGHSVALVDGSGALGPRRTGAGAGSASRMAILDVDGDDDLDIVSSGFPIRAVTYGDGEGDLRGVHAAGNVSSLHMQDLDGDGRRDLLIGTNEGVYAALGEDFGDFGPLEAASSLPPGMRATHLADFDADGVLDLATASSLNYSYLKLGLGDGTFEQGQPLIGVGNSVSWITSGDLDGDGHRDALHLYHANGGDIVRTAPGNGFGGWSAGWSVTHDYHASEVHLADVDGDGALDYALDHAWGEARLALGLGDGTFADWTGIPNPNGARDLVFVDADVDGHLDLVTVSDALLSSQLNDGLGGFAAPLTSTSVEGARSLALGDLDGDGLLDAVAGADGATGVHAGRGDGSFEAAVPYELVGIHPTLTDLDEDGWLDLVLYDDAYVAFVPNERGPWSKEGAPLAGVQGLPELEGEGFLLPGSPWRLRLDDAAPGATTTLVIGLAPLGTPFQGGTLVPAPDVLVGPIPTDATGGYVLSDSWPTDVPPGTTLWWQAWVADPQGVSGFAATNGLRSDVP